MSESGAEAENESERNRLNDGDNEDNEDNEIGEGESLESNDGLDRWGNHLPISGAAEVRHPRSSYVERWFRAVADTSILSSFRPYSVMELAYPHVQSLGLARSSLQDRFHTRSSRRF